MTKGDEKNLVAQKKKTVSKSAAAEIFQPIKSAKVSSLKSILSLEIATATEKKKKGVLHPRLPDTLNS